ncbi:MAG: SPASM domain-containing protein [Planctomycetes bacterium]|nr:SPASM domain-containing protein [Planctomycetota bacterium]
MPPHVPWLAGLPPRPLCPVPWEGNTVVTSNGAVQLCCFSDAVVGNVQTEPFQAIWNGKTMQRIRRTLAAGALPPECRTGSCPFFRGDTLHYLIDRRDGAFRDGAAEQVQQIAAQRLAGTRCLLPERVRRGDRLRVRLDLRYSGEPGRVDVFVCRQDGNGVLRFLPDGQDFPVPALFDQGLAAPGATMDLADVAVDGSFADGRHQVCVALFLPDSDPNLQNHCFWSTTADVTVSD